MIDVSSKDVRAALKGVPLLIMSQKTVDETKSCVICPGPGIRNHTLTIKIGQATTGTIQWETADDPDYTGLWSPLGGGTIDLSTIGAAGVLELQFPNIIINAIRGRIETVANHPVDLIYTGN